MRRLSRSCLPRPLGAYGRLWMSRMSKIAQRLASWAPLNTASLSCTARRQAVPGDRGVEDLLSGAERLVPGPPHVNEEAAVVVGDEEEACPDGARGSRVRRAKGSKRSSVVRPTVRSSPSAVRLASAAADEQTALSGAEPQGSTPQAIRWERHRAPQGARFSSVRVHRAPPGCVSRPWESVPDRVPRASQCWRRAAARR